MVRREQESGRHVLCGVGVVVDLGGGRFKFKNKKSGKFVAVIDGSTDDGAGIEQRTGTEGEEQQFRIVPR